MNQRDSLVRPAGGSLPGAAAAVPATPEAEEAISTGRWSWLKAPGRSDFRLLIALFTAGLLITLWTVTFLRVGFEQRETVAAAHTQNRSLDSAYEAQTATPFNSTDPLAPRRRDYYWGAALGTAIVLVFALALAAALSRQRRTLTSLARSEARLRATFSQAAIGIAQVALDGRYLQVNQKLCDMLGYSERELLARTIFEVTHPADMAKLGGLRRELPDAPQPALAAELEKRYVRKDGSVMHVAVTTTVVRNERGEPDYFVGMVQDISVRRQAEDQLRKVDRARHVMAECNRVLVHADDEVRLLQHMCDTVVGSGGYHLAWVGYAEDDARKSVRAMAQSGFDAGYLDALRISWDDACPEYSATGRAISSGEVVVVNNVLTDAGFAQWRAGAVKHGYGSLIALPLSGSWDARLGALTIYATETGAFDPAEIVLLQELAADLSYGLLNLRLRADHARSAASLRESEARMRAMFEQAAVGFALTDLDGRYTEVNQKLCEILGYTREELRGKSFREISHPDDVLAQAEMRRKREQGLLTSYSIEKRCIRKDGSLVWVNSTITLALGADGAAQRLIAVVEDITGRKEMQDRMLHLAHYDSLTQLPNRVLFHDRLKQALGQAQRRQWINAIMFVDLDRFKLVNDTLGHPAGDRLLQLVSERLAQCVRVDDTVSRLGGDEFAVLLSDLAQAQDATLVAQKILDVLAEPFQLDDNEAFVTASIGISIYPGDSTEVDTLINNADIAMYRAKELGRNNYQFYTAALNERAMDKLHLENDLRGALSRKEFLLHFQPKASLATGEITGFEALLRWQRRGGRLISPAEFIPLLEESGLIVPVGEWVLHAACAQIVTWQDLGVTPLPIAVNLSAKQFQRQDICAVVRRVLHAYAIDPRLLELEITESAAMQNTEETIAALQRLKSLGLHISMDDFGTGYSSLSYLKRLPVDCLKIDRSFITELVTNPDDASIARAVITMAHSLQLKVIAEGVETADQLAFLTANGCDEMQGYYFSRPLPAHECTDLLKQGRQLPRPAAVEDARLQQESSANAAELSRHKVTG
jgi:diguanylate cyclase (GGDEF)-like protein/PAS domain S-box-containing protein